MKAKLQMQSRKRRGDILIVLIAVAAVIVLFGMFLLEVQKMYDYQYAIEVRAQRAVNTTVEYSMDDQWRSDGYNYMDIPTASACLMGNLREALNLNAQNQCVDANGNILYEVDFGVPTYYRGDESQTQCAEIAIDIRVTMRTGFSATFGIPDYTWKNTITSTNFRTDENMRGGMPH